MIFCMLKCCIHNIIVILQFFSSSPSFSPSSPLPSPPSLHPSLLPSLFHVSSSLPYLPPASQPRL